MPDYPEATAAYASPGVDRDASPIDTELYKVDAEINELDDVTRVLVQRLERVMAPPVPQGPADGNRLAEVRQERAPLAMSMRESADRLHAIRDRLLGALHRLEL